MSAKLLFGADFHLDSRGPGGFNSQEGLPQNSVEAFSALRQTIDLANEHLPALIVFPGDMLDTGRPATEIVARLDEEFARLDPRVKVVLIDGNHDQQGVLAGHRTASAAYFEQRPYVASIFSSSGVFEYSGLTVAAMPWVKATSSNLLGATNDSLRQQVDALASQVRPGDLSVFAGHLTLAECTFDSGRRGSEVGGSTSTLEASIPAHVLEEGPWMVSRLGHIHKRQQLTDSVGYIGSPFKVSFGEVHDKKGVEFVTLNEDGSSSVEFVQLRGRELFKVDLVSSSKVAPFDANSGDIVRIVVDKEGLPKAEALARSYQSAGAAVQIHQVPSTLAAVVREAKYSTEMAPLDAIKAFLAKREVSEEMTRATLAAFGDVSASCSH